MESKKLRRIRNIIMRTSIIRGVPISILSLGTVQLGLNYGANNISGKPDEATAFAILNCAMEQGINAKIRQLLMVIRKR